MLTETQLLETRATVHKIAKRFKYLGGADDLTQTAILHMWENREKFDGVDPINWAARTTRRQFINMLKSRMTRRGVLGMFALVGGYYPRAVSTPEETCYANECARVHEVSRLACAHLYRPEVRARELTAKVLA